MKGAMRAHTIVHGHTHLPRLCEWPRLADILLIFMSARFHNGAQTLLP